MKKLRWALLGLGLLLVPALQAGEGGKTGGKGNCDKQNISFGSGKFTGGKIGARFGAGKFGAVRSGDKAADNKAADNKAEAGRRGGRGGRGFQRGGQGGRGGFQRGGGQDNGGRGRFQFGGGGASLPAEKDLESLKLTSEQKPKVAKIYKDYEAKQKDLAKQFEGLRSGERPDPAKFREMFEARTKAVTGAESKIKALLTDEQKKKFDELKPRGRVGGFGGRDGRGGPGGPGGFGRPGGFGGGFGPPGGRFTPGQVIPGALKDRLELTEDQKTKIDALEKDLKTKLDKILTVDQMKKLQEGPGRPGADGPGRPRRPGGGGNSDRPQRPPSN
jgi:Spy/CpxP family protein refolding chaperone